MESKKPRDQRNLFDAKAGVEGDEEVEGWFYILDEINKALDTQRIGKFKRVKIAILDTGIDMTNSIFDTPEAKERIKRREDFLREDPLRTDAHDKCGHGSHCAGLLRRVAPAADIYVARVAKDFNTDLDAEVVAKAIERACMPKKMKMNEAGWDVDIITMSFGFEVQSEPVERALRKALDRDKIMFAAASNSGSRKEVAFPAWCGGVVCINSATADGTPSKFNPVVEFPNNFATLGENVNSAWISSQPNPKVNTAKHSATKIMTGTSMATPIAAAVVSLLLEVAMNPGRAEARRILEFYLPKIRKYEGTEMILKQASVQINGYRIIDPNFLKNVDRLGIAYWVQDALRRRYGVPGDSENQRGSDISTSPVGAASDAGAGNGGLANLEAHSAGSSNADESINVQPEKRSIDESPSQMRSNKAGTAPDVHRACSNALEASVSAPNGLSPCHCTSCTAGNTAAASHIQFGTDTGRSHEHILPDANSYWRYLTLAAYEIYEKIYENCKDDRGSGWVYYTSFTAQFIAAMTPPGTIKSTWSRLLRDQSNVAGSRHPKGLAMATLYMLHLESYRPYLQPLNDEREVGVSRQRRPLLKGFGNWVGCRCKAECAVQWNFVNDIGLHRGGKPTSCILVKFIDSGGKVGRFSLGKKEDAARENTLQDWLKSLNS
ncbi:hypothetical protein DL769_004433 [Monosporascus sp. CRB-8-3]|nr:hypothetical protein DL769_004433 [Monosporascus sp. CRB-8-3]